METLISIPSASLSLHVAPSSNRSTRKSRPSICLSSSASSLFSSSSFKSNFNSSVYGGAVEIRNRRSRKTERNKSRLSCTCLFGLGVPELVVIAGVAALVFGPKKLPDIGRSIGKTVKSFQQAAKEFETELKKEPDSALDSPVEKTTPTEEGKEEIKATSIKESL